jgi:steroid delta-isomerase-like uncharacterized protein
MRPLQSLLISLVFCCAAVPSNAADAPNVRTAKRVLLEKMGEGRFDKLDEIYAPGFVAHGSNDDYTLEQDNESGRAWRRAFPDLKVTVERTAASEDLVAVHWRATGTNTGKDAGTPGLGEKVDVQGMTFFRFNKAGLIVEEWSLMDIASLMTQLGQ